MKRYFALLFVLATLAIPAQASAGSCSLITGRTGWYVTVNRGPCYYRDFPSWCNAYVPSKIYQGMKIRCELKAPRYSPKPHRTPVAGR
jgi:hypothetical protein